MSLLVLVALDSNGLSATPVASPGQRCDLLMDPQVFASHLEDNGLIQFRISGVAHFQGRVITLDADALSLQGQFGAPRRFSMREIKDLKLLRNERGEAQTDFEPLDGPEISRAFREPNPPRGGFEDAVWFALNAHGPQIYNDVHYGVHLDEVVAVLSRFAISDPDVRIAAVLHDVIEDTPVTYEEVRDRFGRTVADAVRAVSLPRGLSRDEAFERLYPAIRHTPGALFVKLADRIANVEDALDLAASGDPRHLMKYASEWAHFRSSLVEGADPTALGMLEYLDKLLTTNVIEH